MDDVEEANRQFVRVGASRFVSSNTPEGSNGTIDGAMAEFLDLLMYLTPPSGR
jgi:hypothetical protein